MSQAPMARAVKGVNVHGQSGAINVGAMKSAAPQNQFREKDGPRAISRGELRTRRGGIERDLDEAVPIAKIDEDESSEIARPMDPATEANGCSDVLGAQCAAEMGSLGCG